MGIALLVLFSINPFFVLNILNSEVLNAYFKNLQTNWNVLFFLQGIFMYATNRKTLGHLVDYDNMDTSHLHNDLYQMKQNPYVSTGINSEFLLLKTSINFI